MANSSSSDEAGILCRFVKVCDTPSAACLEAYEEIREIGAKSEWFSADEAFTVAAKERKTLYVFEDFGGPAFRHVATTGNRIFGPVCILHSIKQDKQLPSVDHPVFSRAMEGLVVSCTGLDKKDRERLHEKMSWMLAEVNKDFHDRVTHLVAAEVGSKKYIVAANLRKRIMSPEWVDAVWEASQTSLMDAHDPQFDRFRCPVFKGHVITVSGIDSSERTRLKQHIEREGGRYSGEMKINECTHLIIEEPTGQKYEFARKWHIHVVRPQWLYDSLDKGYSQEEHRYKVEGRSKTTKSTSTPTSNRDVSRVSSLGDISAITTSRIDETAMSNNASSMSLMGRLSMGGARNSVGGARFSMGGADNSMAAGNKSVALASLSMLDNLEIAATGKGDMFLDGSKIFLSGFTAQQMDKLRKIINIGGGTRFNQINSSVSHVVCGKLMAGDMDQIENCGLRPHVVGVDWLVDCWRQGMCMPEESYYCVDMPDNSDVSDIPAEKTAVMSRAAPAAEAGSTKATGDDMDDIMSQYLPGNKSGSIGESTLLRAVEMASQEQGNTTVVASKSDQVETEVRHEEQMEDDDMTQDITVGGEAEDDRGLLAGMTFALIGFDSREAQEELTQFIEDAEGKVTSLNSRKVPDYGVVPLFSVPVQMTVGEVVTNAWLQMCVQDEVIYPVSDNTLFSPLDVDMDAQPLQGCVLSISGISGAERDVLLHVAEVAGARCQDFFVKKPNDTLAASTHLVCSAAEGSKYKAAIKWKLPAVTKQWVLACLKAGEKLDESGFLVKPHELNEPQPMSASTPQTARPMSVPTPQAARPMSVSTPQAVRPMSVSTPQAARPMSVSTPLPSNAAPSVNSKAMRGDYGSGVSVSSPIQTAVARVDTEARASVSGVMKTMRIGDGFDEVTETSTVTPLQNTRVKQLKQSNREKTPQNSSSQNNRWWNNIPGVDSPSTFMDENKSFRPRFDLTGYSNMFPPTPTTPGGTKFKPKTREEEASDQFTKGMDMVIANQNRALAEGRRMSVNSQQLDDTNDSMTGNQPAGPLYGVVIAVSKKLSASQSELNNVASALGADYRWTYDSECTHYIFKGRQNDLNKEFRMARDEGKIIVSPHWLMMCKEQNGHVQESLFPHTYNPNLSLAVKSTPTPARRRGTRSRITRNNQPDPAPQPADLPAPPPAPIVTPGKANKRPLDIEVITEVESSLKKKMRLAGGDLDKTQSDEEMTTACNEVETKVKEEETVSLVKDLKNLMQVTKTNTRSKRRNRGKELSDSMGSDGGSGFLRRGSRDQLQGEASLENVTPVRTSRRLHSTRKLQVEPTCTETLPEASQMCEVSWDDPDSRAQRKMLAAELAKNSESFSPHHGTAVGSSSDEDIHQAIGLPVFMETGQQHEDAHDLSGVAGGEAGKRIPTPDNPSLAFPLPKSAGHCSPPRPVELLDPDDPDMTVGELPPDDAQADKKENKQPPVFLLSGMSSKERDMYGALIEELGGKLSDSNYYDPNCSHLVIGVPTRNEKYLACVASGKWILHKSFLESSRLTHRFVEEEEHEWGGVGTERLLSSLQPVARRLASAAHRWRINLSSTSTSQLSEKGTFATWNAVLLTDSKKEDGFRRLLQAGGANVLPAKQALGDLSGISHAIIDLNKVTHQVDIASMVQAGIHCVKPEYIAAYLTDDPPPHPRTHYIPQAT